MKSLDFLFPSVLAGSVRTLIGKQNGSDWTRLIPDLKAVGIHGPILRRNDGANDLFVPAAKDAVLHPDGPWLAARPITFAPGEGWDLGDDPYLRPAVLPEMDDFKPDKQAPTYWSMSAAARWLADPTGAGFRLATEEGLKTLEKQQRTHVQIDPASFAAQEGRLFTTEGLEFPDDLQIEARLEVQGQFEKNLDNLRALHRLGGEQRIARFQIDRRQAGWECPAEVAKALRSASAKRYRIQLVTPAIFTHGWKPEWITKELGLTLTSVCMDRWRPISGWSYETRGPKTVRRVVPAGSVYFFESKRDLGEELVARWLQPVSDDDQDRRDGFGLAVWGVW